MAAARGVEEARPRDTDRPCYPPPADSHMSATRFECQTWPRRSEVQTHSTEDLLTEEESKRTTLTSFTSLARTPKAHGSPCCRRPRWWPITRSAFPDIRFSVVVAKAILPSARVPADAHRCWVIDSVGTGDDLHRRATRFITPRYRNPLPTITRHQIERVTHRVPVAWYCSVFDNPTPASNTWAAIAY